MMETPLVRFEALIDKHRRILHKVSRSYTTSTVDREDLTQEIVFALWRSFPRYDARATFSTWMYRVALNVAISFSRKERTRSRRVFSGADELLEAVPDSLPSKRSDDIALVYETIASLEPLSRALMLLYLDGYAYREIAATLGISETNVATKLSRLKLHLKRKASA